MDLLTQLNLAMVYVEEHIGDDVALRDVSSVTAYSEYHFGRLFYYIAEMPLSEYIRKRKLSLAAMDLQNGYDRIIDLAVKYGYDSADSFTRAFVKQHGVTPTAARKNGVTLKIFPPITFQIKIKGVQEMKWRIEQKEAFEVFGVERIFDFTNDKTNHVPAFWEELKQNGTYDMIMFTAGGGRTPDGHESHNGPLTEGSSLIMGFVGEHIEGGGIMPYMLCAIKNDGCKTEGYNVVQVPKSTWAVFREEGMKDHNDCQIGTLFHRAYSEWLPSSGYDKATGPDMEIYGEHFEEVWIPVVKKEM